MRHLIQLLTVALLILGLLTPLAHPAPAHAETELGYLWSLTFDFDQSLDAILTIEVGPWKNGDLVAVDETSQSIVPCKREGSVYLSGGNAVFAGGHLVCEMNLGATVWNNHGLQISAVDSYGSILVQTSLQATANTVAPIISHPDAAYSIDFTQTSSVTLEHELQVGAGLPQAPFPGVVGTNWQSYAFWYACISNGGPCDANYQAGLQKQSLPTAGGLVSFSTGPTSFLIGGDGSATFRGRMDSLLIDPGNTVH